MLGKLIKYDSKAMARNMFVIFAAMLILSTVFALMIRLKIEEGFIFSLFASLFSASITASLFGTMVMIVLRFRNGLLKNEGYLSFALPVKTSTHIIAKVINALIWSAAEMLALLLCTLIMVLIVGSIEDVRMMISELLKIFGLIDRDVIIAFLKGMLVLGLELIAAVCLIYSAYAVAHLFDKYQRLIILAYLILIAVIKSTILPFGTLYEHELFWYLNPVISAAIYSLITWYILDRRLNLE